MEACHRPQVGQVVQLEQRESTGGTGGTGGTTTGSTGGTKGDTTTGGTIVDQQVGRSWINRIFRTAVCEGARLCSPTAELVSKLI